MKYLVSVALAAAAVGVAGLPLSSAGSSATPKTTSGHLEIIERLTEGVWLIRQSEPFQLRPVGNVTVIEQSDGLILVDSGGSPGSGRRIVALVRSVSPKPVKAVLVTHWHNDHPLGLPAIKEAWPQARVIAHSRTRDHLLGPPLGNLPKNAPDQAVDALVDGQVKESEESLGQSAQDANLSAEVRAGFLRTLAGFSTIRSDLAGRFVVPPTEVFNDRLLIDDPLRPVEFRHLGRANTDGDAIAWLPRERIVVTGDIVVAPVPFGFGSYPADWVKTLGRIKALDFALLVPGHGVPQRDSRYIDQLTALITEVRAQMAPLAAQGLELAEARERIDLSAQKAAFAGDDQWLGRGFDRFWVRPITESAWREAKGMEIVQSGG